MNFSNLADRWLMEEILPREGTTYHYKVGINTPKRVFNIIKSIFYRFFLLPKKSECRTFIDGNQGVVYNTVNFEAALCCFLVDYEICLGVVLSGCGKQKPGL
jgi:hypothetical protein